MMKEFPLFEVSDAEVAFGWRGKWLTREECGDFYGFGHDIYSEAVNSLFYKGGKLEDYGLKFKPEIDKEKAWRAIRAMLTSWEPKHEIKCGTVATALSQWCEVVNA
jgi:hypothetical protein